MVTSGPSTDTPSSSREASQSRQAVSPAQAESSIPQLFSSALLILTGNDVDQILHTLSVEVAVESQSKVFKAFSAQSRPKSSPNLTDVADSGVSKSTTTSSVSSVQTPQRINLQSHQVTTLFMPSRVQLDGGEKNGSMACKIVSVPTAGGDGLPASTVVVDETRGNVKALVNARKLTAIRNAAGSALFYGLMKSERVSKSLLIFGSGAQALSHATFFLALHPTISSCTFIVRKSTPRSKSLLRTLESQFPNVDFEIGESTYTQQTDDQSFQEPVEPFAASSTPFNLSQVVHNANIIICATPSTEPLFNSVDVTSQTRIILIGSYKPHMREVDNELIRRAGLVVVDSAEACLAESGELIGSKKRDEDLVELGELVDDEELRDKVVKSGDIVLFKSASLLVGIGLQDVAITELVVKEAEAKELGTIVENYD